MAKRRRGVAQVLVKSAPKPAPVPLFGGEESFARQQERDARKIARAQDNDAATIEAHPAYAPDELVQRVRKAIAARQMT